MLQTADVTVHAVTVCMFHHQYTGNAELAVDYYLRKSRVKHNLILRKRRNLPDMGTQ